MKMLMKKVWQTATKLQEVVRRPQLKWYIGLDWVMMEMEVEWYQSLNMVLVERDINGLEC